MPNPMRSNDRTSGVNYLGAKQLVNKLHIFLLMTSKSLPKVSPARIIWLN